MLFIKGLKENMQGAKSYPESQTLFYAWEKINLNWGGGKGDKITSQRK